MGVRFNKSIKIGSLLKLNISKSGVSATIGKKGASINLGSKGTYLNLSPSVAGLSGTGLSYRQKITGGYSSLLKKVTGSSKEDKKEEKNKKQEVKEIEEKTIDTNSIDEYEKYIEENINIHKYADKVLTKKQFDEKIESLESKASKDVYQLLIDGDEDTIESSVGAFLNNLDLNYEVKANYELEDNILYVDLDLPEIEEFKKEKPVLNKEKIEYKKLTNAELKEEYGKSVLSLGIFIAANFFNVSSYIEQIVLSGFTSRRNNDGDLVDEYLYSVKFTRNVYIESELDKLEDTYKFILQFENRINMSDDYNFKQIKPYEIPSVEKANQIVLDAVAGLRELGYKNADINLIIEKLKDREFKDSSECLKEALKLLANK